MKNLFGVMPGVAYGWPKNVCTTRASPARSSTSTRRSRRAWRSSTGSSGWKGTGRSWARLAALGVLVMGTNLPGVDATAARLMGIDPDRVSYLAGASGRLGPIAEATSASGASDSTSLGPALRDPRPPEPRPSAKLKFEINDLKSEICDLKSEIRDLTSQARTRGTRDEPHELRRGDGIPGRFGGGGRRPPAPDQDQPAQQADLRDGPLGDRLDERGRAEATRSAGGPSSSAGRATTSSASRSARS